jgi:hypothetical protein
LFRELRWRAKDEPDITLAQQKPIPQRGLDIASDPPARPGLCLACPCFGMGSAPLGDHRSFKLKGIQPSRRSKQEPMMRGFSGVAYRALCSCSVIIAGCCAVVKEPLFIT